MQQLIEGVLTIGARLAENHGAGGVVHRLAEAVDGFTVALHVQLLKMGRKTAQSLRVWKNRGGGIAQHIALVNANQSIQHGGILPQVGVLCQPVSLGSAAEEVGEDLGAKGKRQHAAAHAGGRGEPTADVVIHEESRQIVGRLGQRRGLGGDSDHVMCRVQTGFGKRVLDKGFIGQRLQRGAGFGHQHEQRVGQIQIAQDTGGVVGINIRDEGSLHFQGIIDLCPVLQRQIDGTGAQIGTADADLADGSELLTGSVGDLPGVNLVRELRDPLLLAYIEFPLVNTVSYHVLAQLSTAQVVQNQTLFTGVDHFAVIQGGELLHQLLLGSELLQNGENIIVHWPGSIVKVHARAHGNRIVFYTFRAVFAAHGATHANLVRRLKLFIGRQSIHVLPGNQFHILLKNCISGIIWVLSLF